LTPARIGAKSGRAHRERVLGISLLNFEFGRVPARPPLLSAGPVYLRAPAAEDHDAWVRLREQSRAHLTRWEPDWRPAETTFDAFRLRLKAYERQFRARSGVAFHIFERGGRLAGGVTLSDIRRHAAQSTTIGYWIGAPFLRRGYGLAAVEAATAYAFDALHLNRVEAACQPGNVASRSLLEKAGFTEEGLARDYLFINGAWRDHVLYARLARDRRG